MTPRGHRPAVAATSAGYILFLAWVLVGLLLVLWWMWAWTDSDGLRALVMAMERGYGLRPGQQRWLWAADGHLHLFTAALGVAWLGVACHLFTPQRTRWLPIIAMVGISVIDELAQLGSSGRTADLGDQVWSAAGIVLALPVLAALHRADARRRSA